MRASFYEGAGRFRTGSAAVPTAGAGEALLRVRRVGICGTDLHIYQGHLDHRVPKGGIIGHETFAEVTEAPPAGGGAPRRHRARGGRAPPPPPPPGGPPPPPGPPRGPPGPPGGGGQKRARPRGGGPARDAAPRG